MEQAFGHSIVIAIAAFALLALFIPFIQIPYAGTASLVSDGWGKVMFVMALLAAVMFFSGAKVLYTRSVAVAFALILFFVSFDLVSSINDMGNAMSLFGGRQAQAHFSPFSMFKLGFYLTVLASIMMLWAAFKPAKVKP